MKITIAQREALLRIAAGGVHERKLGSCAIRIQGANPTVVGRLIQTMQLAEWTGTFGSRVARLTDAGREALERNPS
jgi:hypothetical protein